jgi:putative ABC transport system permease protein
MQLFRQFRKHPLRSILATIAFALGVGQVTLTSTVLDLNNQYSSQVEEAQGTRTLQLFPGDFSVDDFYKEDGSVAPVRLVREELGPPVLFNMEDMAAALEASPTVRHAYTETVRGFIKDRYIFDVIAVTAGYFEGYNVKTQQGSLFSHQDFEEQRDVALVTPEFIKRYGVEGNPVGQTFTMDGNYDVSTQYTIVGVLGETISNADIILPFRMMFTSELAPFYFIVDKASDLPRAREELQTFADTYWGEGKVSLSSYQSWRAFQTMQRDTRLVVAMLAATGILIAALNIMSLVLSKVLAKTKAIGILRTVGASRPDIMRQFLGEALQLGLLGGLLGIGMSYFLVLVFNSYVERTRQSDFIPHLAVSLTSLSLGVGLALVLSLLSGLYPAFLAARLRVVDALRQAL